MRVLQRFSEMLGGRESFLRPPPKTVFSSFVSLLVRPILFTRWIAFCTTIRRQSIIPRIVIPISFPAYCRYVPIAII